MRIELQLVERPLNGATYNQPPEVGLPILLGNHLDPSGFARQADDGQMCMVHTAILDSRHRTFRLLRQIGAKRPSVGLNLAARQMPVNFTPGEDFAVPIKTAA